MIAMASLRADTPEQDILGPELLRKPLFRRPPPSEIYTMTARGRRLHVAVPKTPDREQWERSRRDFARLLKASVSPNVRGGIGLHLTSRATDHGFFDLAEYFGTQTIRAARELGLDRNVANGVAIALRGAARLHLGKFREGTRDLEAAAEIASETNTREILHSCWSNLAMVRFMEGDIERARELCSKAIADDPNEAHGQFTYGLIMQEIEDESAALAAFRMATELRNRAIMYRYHWGVAELCCGEPEVARKLFEDVASVVGKSVFAIFAGHRLSILDGGVKDVVMRLRPLKQEIENVGNRFPAPLYRREFVRIFEVCDRLLALDRFAGSLSDLSAEDLARYQEVRASPLAIDPRKPRPDGD